MDRFDVINFADLTGPDGKEWVRIGGGSFGVVFKGDYLGTQVAIKEVLPNNTYDVEKYFERECVLMKEARHPNIVQYIGLTKSPQPDGRIYIISEYVGGNLRAYIADTHKPFPWRLRISFAIDIARALTYLHVRNCMHRDLKGENLLITANDRIKVCDFGFARIAARNEEEMRRISYCGTDGYMSPEILLGVDFSLPSDVFSLGIIFAEIASRHLVDSNTFKRTMPGFGLDADEVREMASEACPLSFIQLTLDCVEEDPEDRPDMRQIVARLRDIEREILARDEKENCYNIGSVRGASIHSIMGTKSKRAMPPRLPSFNGTVKLPSVSRSSSEDSSNSGDELEEALAALEKVGINPDHPNHHATIASTATLKVSGHGNPWWSEDVSETLPSVRDSWMHSPAARAECSQSENRLLDYQDYTDSEYSTSVVRSSKVTHKHAPLPIMEENGSTMTFKQTNVADISQESHGDTTQSYMTARTHRAEPSLALATIASAPSEFLDLDPLPLHHRFTLVKNGTRRPSYSIQSMAGFNGSGNLLSSSGSSLPPAVMLSNALAKCWVCGKRIGWKPFMDCDDCPYKTHVGCADLAPPTCQDMQIPSGPAGSFVQPVLSTQNILRRQPKTSQVANQKEVSAAAAALRAASLAADGKKEESSGLFKGGKGKKKEFGPNAAVVKAERPL